MKKLLFIILLLIGLFSFLRSSNAVTCFYTGEQTSGMLKICYYDCLSSTAAITVQSYQLCPLIINR